MLLERLGKELLFLDGGMGTLIPDLLSFRWVYLPHSRGESPDCC